MLTLTAASLAASVLLTADISAKAACRSVQVDINRNGFIDSREMEIILNKLRNDGQRVSKLEVKSVMDFTDANGDRLIGFDEFIRVRQSYLSQMGT